jgi:hypothetical protein
MEHDLVDAEAPGRPSEVCLRLPGQSNNLSLEFLHVIPMKHLEGSTVVIVEIQIHG